MANSQPGKWNFKDIARQLPKANTGLLRERIDYSQTSRVDLPEFFRRAREFGALTFFRFSEYRKAWTLATEDVASAGAVVGLTKVAAGLAVTFLPAAVAPLIVIGGAFGAAVYAAHKAYSATNAVVDAHKNVKRKKNEIQAARKLRQLQHPIYKHHFEEFSNCRNAAEYKKKKLALSRILSGGKPDATISDPSIWTVPELVWMQFGRVGVNQLRRNLEEANRLRTFSPRNQSKVSSGSTSGISVSRSTHVPSGQGVAGMLARSQQFCNSLEHLKERLLNTHYDIDLLRQDVEALEDTQTGRDVSQMYDSAFSAIGKSVSLIEEATKRYEAFREKLARL